MFKKKCSSCGNAVSRKYDFCPFCGSQIKKETFGQKGMIDEDLENFGFGGFGSGLGMPFESLLNKLMKDIDRQMKELDSSAFQQEKQKKSMKKNFGFGFPVQTSGISISISSSGNGEPVIKIKNLGDAQQQQFAVNNANEQKPEKKQSITKISMEDAEKISKLPRTEPATTVRRLTDKIIYEIDLPNVKKENVFISRLQNSIEIKAFTKDRAFFKLLPISLPILKYYIENNKLMLELKPEM